MDPTLDFVEKRDDGVMTPTPNLANQPSESLGSIYAIFETNRTASYDKSHYRIPTNWHGQAMSLCPFLCTCSSIHIRVFHIAWITFFVCFFTWFSLTNLMIHIQNDLQLTAQHKATALVLRALSTILFRIVFGALCDKIGARYSYALLLIISCTSFLCMSWLSYDGTSYVVCSFFIGIIGASFVITQYHVTQFFSARCVGIANALSAGWGNFGGGVTQLISPLMFDYLIQNKVPSSAAWRSIESFFVFVLFMMTIIYLRYTVDSPQGNKPMTGAFGERFTNWNVSQYRTVVKDYRVWILALSYGACFGVEITVLNYFVSYFHYEFGTSTEVSGSIVVAFSCLNLFARGVGGYLSDFLYASFGIQGRVYCLCLGLMAESLFLAVFACSAYHFGYSVMMMIFFSFYVQMTEGIVFAIVPSFPKSQHHGLYMGIVGAGGNFGALIYSFLIFKHVPHAISYEYAWIICSISVFASAFSVLYIRFTQKERAKNTSTRTRDEYITKDYSAFAHVNSNKAANHNMNVKVILHSEEKGGNNIK